MTWHWTITNGTDLEVWDHTQDPSTDAPIETVTQNGGWSWSGEFPNAVLDVMASAAETAVSDGRTRYSINVLVDGAFEQIARV